MTSGQTSAEQVAPDGSPVEVYRRLPEGDDAELVHSAIPERCTVLDLGCGTGRIARGLHRFGHAVTGVDNDANMLAELPPGVEGVLGDVTSIRLDRHFGAVLLASHFLNEDEALDTLLGTVRAHLALGGAFVAQVYPEDLDWLARVGAARLLGEVEVTLVRASVEGDVLDAEMRYRIGDTVWHQPFAARLRTKTDLQRELAAGGFHWDRWIDEGRSWLLARHV